MGDAFKVAEDPTRRENLRTITSSAFKCWRNCRVFSH